MKTGINKSKKSSVTMMVALLALSACLICAMSDGIKNNYGIMLGAIIDNSGMTYASVSFVLAVGQLLYGIFQPVFGVMAQKKGGTKTLILGVCLMLAGLLLLPHCKSPLSLTFCLGVLLPAGTGATSYGILIGTVTPRIPQSTVSFVSGVVNASSGVGNALLSPVIQTLLAKGGILAAMMVLSVPTLLMIPLCLFVGHGKASGNEDENAGTAAASGDLADAGAPGSAVVTQKGVVAKVLSPFSDALQSRTYQLLMVGFFTCGFHMALISNHLPSQITTYGISEAVSSYVFSVYGILTMAGSVLSGWITGRLRMKNVLGTYYGIRSVITLVFFALPKTLPVILGYAVLLGMTGAATVPPVSGLIGREFGARRVGALYGFVFFIHSLGGFLGAWLGGLCVDVFGGYVQIWAVDIVLSAVAAAASYMIKS